MLQRSAKPMRELSVGHQDHAYHQRFTNRGP
jgi:hypothetical protein